MVGLVDSLVSVKPLKAMARESLADGVIAPQTQELNLATRRQVIAKESRKAIQSVAFSMLVARGAWAGLQSLRAADGDRHRADAAPVEGALELREGAGGLPGDGVLRDLLLGAPGDARRCAARGRAAEGTIPPRLEHGIRFERVGFAYADTAVLTDCSLEIPFGSFHRPGRAVRRRQDDDPRSRGRSRAAAARDACSSTARISASSTCAPGGA